MQQSKSILLLQPEKLTFVHDADELQWLYPYKMTTKTGWIVVYNNAESYLEVDERSGALNKLLCKLPGAP